ncbi:Crp/Fnr family transcriptional regulator [Nonomuraea fuscirosea]|uniref:Crp/Fnr family transcriptional regulator n=1 Tax=Nonomuraea fuscirosea TaxID=1291556 RepID=UPI003427595C
MHAPRIATAQTLTRAAEAGRGQALFVPRDRFARLLRERPNLGKCVQPASLVRQRSTGYHLTQICALPPEQRLSHCLMNLGRRYGRPGDGSHDLGIPITQQDLADWTGVSRETVERILRSWRRRGLWKPGGGGWSFFSRRDCEVWPVSCRRRDGSAGVAL